MPIGAPLLNAGGGVIQGILGSISAKRNTDRTIQANKEQAKYAFDQNRIDRNEQNAYNYNLWQEQNLYNSPEQQMQRYKDAGLNPNLIYGTGTTSAGNTGMAPKSETAQYQAPRQEYNYAPPNIGGAIAQYQDARMKNVQIDSVVEQTKGTELENQLKAGSIQHQLGILKAQARQAGDTASLKNIELAERKWSWANNIQIDKWATELAKSQFEATTAGNRATISEWEKKLSEQGMSVNDPLWMRQLQDKGQSIMQWFEKMWKKQDLNPRTLPLRIN